LGDSEKSAALLYKIIDKYTLHTNLFSLHPPLEPSDSPLGTACETCFRESASNPNIRMRNRKDRGLVTLDDSKVQLDGSMGLLAAIGEMLIQSHYPGSLILLPSLPKAFISGELKGMIARGNVKVDLKWVSGDVMWALLDFKEYHFWNNVKVIRHGDNNVDDSGFYNLDSIKTDKREIEIAIFTPNHVQYLSPKSDSCAIKLKKKTGNGEHNITKLFFRMDFLIKYYPCKIHIRG
jgi:hypothetical protein